MSQYGINKIREEEIERARQRGGEEAADKVMARHWKETTNPITYGYAGAKAGGLIGGPAGAGIGALAGFLYGFFKMEI